MQEEEAGCVWQPNRRRRAAHLIMGVAVPRLVMGPPLLGRAGGKKISEICSGVLSGKRSVEREIGMD